jgi:integrase
MARRRTPGEGSIRYRKNRNVFEAAVVTGYNDKGNPVRITKAHRTKTEALTWLEQTKRQVQEGALGNRRLTLTEYATEWLEGIKRRCSPNTIASYELILKKQILPTLGKYQLTDLTPLHISRWTANLETITTPYLVHKSHSYLSMIFNAAMRLELIQKNPAARVRPPKPEKADLQRWSSTEVRKVLEYLETHDNANFVLYIRLGLATGMRKEELRGLRWIDILETEQIIQIRQTVTSVAGKLIFGPPKTKASKRDIYTDPDLLELFKEHRHHQNMLKETARTRWKEHGLILTSELGTPMQDKSLRRWWDAMIATTEVKRIRIYDTRSTFGSTAINQIGNAKTVSKLLGHTDVRFTLQTYIRPDEDEMRAAAKSLKNRYD